MTRDPHTDPADEARHEPYSGLEVVDLTHVLAGPFATYQLALLGARVTRVEGPGEHDISRYQGPDPARNALGLAPGFLVQNAGKRSIIVDLRHRDGQDIVWRLLEGADVLVENFRPGVLERLGFPDAAIGERCPRLVHCSITGYGQSGPLRERPAYDHVVQAATGMMHANATDEGRPRRIGFPVIDYATGLQAAFAVASALHLRAHTGRGSRVDVSMAEAALTLMGPLVAQVLHGAGLRARRGDRAASGSPFSGMFETRDGWLALAANTPAQGASTARVLGLEDLIADPRFTQWSRSPEYADLVESRLRERLARESADAMESLLVRAGVPAARVRDVGDFLESAHIQARGYLEPAHAPVPGTGEIPVPGPGFGLDGRPRGNAHPPHPAPPRPGEHTRAVLESLGIGPDGIRRLEEAGVIECDPRGPRGRPG